MRSFLGNSEGRSISEMQIAYLGKGFVGFLWTILEEEVCLRGQLASGHVIREEFDEIRGKRNAKTQWQHTPAKARNATLFIFPRIVPLLWPVSSPLWLAVTHKGPTYCLPGSKRGPMPQLYPFVAGNPKELSVHDTGKQESGIRLSSWKQGLGKCSPRCTTNTNPCGF